MIAYELPEDAGEAEDLRPFVLLHRAVSDLPALLATIRETQRAREDLQRADQKLNLQIQATYRRLGIKKGASEDDQSSIVSQSQPVSSLAFVTTAHLQVAREVLRPQIAAFDRQLEALAKQMPVWPWVESVRGFGAKGLAQIIGECGDLHNYSGPAKVWKRMGLAVDAEGKRQRRVVGVEALAQGYVPRRRAIMWNIGESLLKGNRDGLYHQVYVARKTYEQAQHPEWENETIVVDGKRQKKYPAIYHKRARRYMEKLLLKHLWQAWRQMTPTA